MSVVLEAQGVEEYRSGKAVLRGVSIRLHSGRVAALLGPTGAGKTTLFDVLVGERRPQRGVVRLMGEDVTKLPMWRRARLGVGTIPQGPTVLPDMEVDGNLTTFERLGGGERKGSLYWARMVGLEQRLGVRAGHLSGGERRLLEIARSMVTRPRVLICDEPFSGIDPAGAMRIAQMLRGLALEGVAVLLSDHHASIALRISDEVGLLLDGEVHFWGSASDWIKEPLVRERYLGGSMDG